MLKHLNKYLKSRRSRSFLIAEARRHMEAINIPTAKMSDRAVHDMVLSFGVAYLQTLALAKQLKEGTERVVFAAVGKDDPVQQVH